MPIAIAFALVGFLLVTSALKGKSVADLFRDGLGTPFNPGATGPKTAPGTPANGTPPTAANGQVVELFYDPLGGWDCESGKCVSIGAIGGHVDHVHVAGDHAVIEALIQTAKGTFNLDVTSRNRPADLDSHHGPDKIDAADLSGAPTDMMAFARYVRDNYIR